jgi:hypothetical protein
MRLVVPFRRMKSSNHFIRKATELSLRGDKYSHFSLKLLNNINRNPTGLFLFIHSYSFHFFVFFGFSEPKSLTSAGKEKLIV